MSPHIRRLVDREFKSFTSKHFEKPSNCRNIEHLRFHIHELSKKIEELRNRFDYVPGCAYSLLSEYNLYQNSLLYHDFRKTYGSLKH